MGVEMQQLNTTTLIVFLVIRLSGGEFHGSSSRMKAPLAG